MGLLKNLKTWCSCQINGKSKEYEDYKFELNSKKSDIIRFEKYLEDAAKRFSVIKQKYPENSKEYINSKNEMYRWKQTLDEANLTLGFIRPNSQEDIDYRNKQCETFPSNLQSVLSPNLDLRFHGTPIYFAEQIIKEGKISSTADRYDGYIKSTDMLGEISVSNGNSIKRTIDFFSDMVAYNRSLPGGCIFAVLPKDKEDASYGQDLMHAVDFKKNPAQLFGIFTTPENKNSVKKWMEESELSPDLVYTFEEFLEVVKTKSAQIDEKCEFANRIEFSGNPISNAFSNKHENNRDKDEYLK